MYDLHALFNVMLQFLPHQLCFGACGLSCGPHERNPMGKNDFLWLFDLSKILFLIGSVIRSGSPPIQIVIKMMFRLFLMVIWMKRLMDYNMQEGNK